ncbi:hypothetical protein FQA39_LY09090 [Lamprigera yunnana]|nr:hypothetical protein FQA39_LY09090 [Lamprigera yunnana]
MTYWYDADRRYKRYYTEVAYVTRYFLEILGETLNVTIVPMQAKPKANITPTEELAASDLPILIDKFNMGLFNKDKVQNNSLYTKLTNKFRLVPFDEGLSAIRNQTALEHNSVFIIFDLMYELMQKYKPKLHVIVDDTLLGIQQRAYTTKAESPFLPTVNNIVNIYLESGLINLKQMEYKRYINKFAHYYDNKLNTTEGNVVLSLNHMYSVFAFWAFGLTFATVVFIVEVLTHIILKKYC